jgi:cell division protein FtsZ
MEGRIRVSVVATGIDAESMQKLPPNVQKLHDRMKQQPVAPAPAKPEPKPAATLSANPVRAQVETLAQEFNPRPMQSATVSVDESLILGHQEEPLVEEEPVLEPQPIPVAARAMPMRNPEPEQAKRLFGIFRRDAKPEPRVEPTPRAQQPVQRASAQVMNRNAGEQNRSATAQQPSPDDLFQGQKTDDQFEIPAFLRRQQN